MKKRSALLALALLLPVLASCRPDSGNTPDDSTAETAALRPVETIVINDACYGNFITVGEDDPPMMLRGVAAGDSFYISSRMPESWFEGDAEDRPFGFFVLPADGGEGSFQEIPHACVPEGKNTELRVPLATVSEFGMAVLDQSYYLDMDARKTIVGQSRISFYDPEGQRLFSVDPEPLITRHENPYKPSASYEFGLEALYIGAAGTVYMVSEFSVTAISPTGEKLYETGEGIYIHQSWRTADGRVLVEYSIPTKGIRAYAYMDDEAKGFSEPVTLPDPGLENYTLHYARGYDYYYQTVNGLYAMNEGDSEASLICSWKESGITISDIGHLLVLSEDVYYLKERGSMARPSGRYGVFRRPADEELEPRIVITLGKYNEHADTEALVDAFNQTNTKYYVRIRDYKKQIYENGNTPQEDVLAGNSPDILFCDSFRKDVTNLAEKGAFLDLNTFLDQDPAFRDSLLQSVYNASLTDGKLYQLPVSVSVSGKAGAKKNLPAPQDWTLEEYMELSEACQADGRMLLRTAKRSSEEGILYNNLASFVDYENAVCSFETEEFLTLLRYLKGQPTEEQYVKQNVAETYKGLREGSILLTAFSMGEFRDYVELTVRFPGEEVIVLGSPTPEGGKLFLNLMDTFAIAADSPVQEGAWEFLRFALQRGTSRMGAFPVYKPLIENTAAVQMRRWFQFSLTDTSSSISSVEPEYDPQKSVVVRLTEDHVAAVMDLLENREYRTTATAGADATVKELIAEELGAYYAGSITAEEAARRIQSRVSIYLAEQS
ncbi:MAG: extracellular solute-binding protein [Clostridia bacterium]|nr:extracellular solute-binding protein [Clostridia bacterium]